LLERFFVCAILKAELCRISGATPQHKRTIFLLIAKLA